MKKSLIKTGHRYTDGRGNVREVIAEGPEYVLYPGQFETDNLRYRVVKKFKGPYAVGSEHNSTRTSFGLWADSEV